MPPETALGTFVPPTIIELSSIAELEREVFGPVLHVVRFRRDALDDLIDSINATGYGLTFGLHTRLDDTIAHVTSRIRAGNLYINRNVIGAIVGVQPFGGRGLSGTGPKAGGPLYLGRLVQVPPALSGHVPAANDALDAFAAWLDARGEGRAADQARAYGAASRLGQVRELAGPVGERNLYALHPRGRILLRARTMAGLCQQIAAVLATGCDGVFDGTVDGMAIPSLLPEIVAGRLSAADDGSLAGALVEGEGAEITQVAEALARRAGAIVPLHAASSAQCQSGRAYHPDWLLEEVATSINTTASGGNATLMAL
jgi:RHH-type proline utilization regulon transcriptional repressor/proline dehydrogenase/delta 1-pyrroline-5-carboxylate dehydrogenase